MPTDTLTDLAPIARVAHEVNRAYCHAIGDPTALGWDDAPEWQRRSAIDGVAFCAENPDAGPEASHQSWYDAKVADGWRYGDVKDANAKTHPCLVPFDRLPLEQQVKDHLFRAVAQTMLALV